VGIEVLGRILETGTRCDGLPLKGLGRQGCFHQDLEHFPESHADESQMRREGKVAVGNLRSFGSQIVLILQMACRQVEVSKRGESNQETHQLDFLDSQRSMAQCAVLIN